MISKPLIASLLALLALTACKQASAPSTFSSFDVSSDKKPRYIAHSIRFQEADVAQVLSAYQEMSGRTIIRSPMVPTGTKINFDNATALTRVEALQGLDNVLAANNIVMVNLGTKYVKALTTKEVGNESGPLIELRPDELPDSSSFLVYVVKLRHLTASDAVSVLTPFAKLPNSIMGARDSDLLILRDYSSNVRRMVQVLEEAEANSKSGNPVRRLFHVLGETNSKSQRKPN